MATFLSVPLIEDDLVNLVLELSENKKPKDLTSVSLYYANRLRRRATTTVIFLVTKWNTNLYFQRAASKTFCFNRPLFT